MNPARRGSTRAWRQPGGAVAAVALLLAAVAPSAPGVLQSVGEIWRQVLPTAENPNPGIRASAAARVAAFGREAFPLLREAVESGSLNRARLALLALAPNASDPEASSVLLGALRRPRHEGLDLLAALGLLGAEGDRVAADLVAVVLDPHEDSLRRAAAALAIGGTGIGGAAGSLQTSLREEKDPIVAAALGAALGLAGVESSIPILEERLASAGEAPLRAGLLLGLGALGRRAVPSAADLLASDPVLPWVAALHFPDVPAADADSPSAEAWRRAIRSSDPSLRAVLYAALGRGTEDRSRAVLTEAAVSETDPRVRAALYGSAAARGAMEILRTVRRVDEDEGAAFAALAWMLEGRSRGLPDTERALLERIGATLSRESEDSMEVAALVLGASRRVESDGALGAHVGRIGIGGEAARLARKHLRGELDPRAFSQAVVQAAYRRGVLFENALAEAAQRFSLALLGAGSEYLGRRPELEGSAKGLRAWLGRRRPLPPDSPVYEDVGMLLERRPLSTVCLRRASR